MSLTEIIYVDSEDLEFTVNNAVNEVNITAAAAPNTSYGEFQNGLGRKFFQEADPFTVINIGYRLPFCFAAGTDIARFQLQWFEPTFSEQHGIDELPTVSIPEPDIIFPYGQYVSWEVGTLPPGMNENISIASFNFNISMIGVPDSLNEEVYRVYPFMTIVHNFDLGNT